MFTVHGAQSGGGIHAFSAAVAKPRTASQSAPVMDTKTLTRPAYVEAVATEVFATLGSGRQIAPFSARPDGLTLDEANRVLPLLRQKFIARGEKIVGRKVGFTNRTIWPEYGVYAPNWGYMTDRTVSDLAAATVLPLGGFVEPRIEPEIVFGFARPPQPGMDDAAMLDCIDWVAHGYEVVQSIYPGWKFTPADTTACNAMHGAMLIGKRHPIAPRKAEWLRELPSFEIGLYRDGVLADRGRASNVLDGPVSALRHLVGLLAQDALSPPLAAGDIVTTGTLTKALPVKPGETWTTQLRGIPLEGIGLRFG
jgi:2-keto-4-pentenoate hydratase